MNKLERESGITLIALIITIIILVILAAVSIRTVTNMKIVDYAMNGSQNYAVAGIAENKMLDNTVSFIDEAVEKVNNPFQDEEGTKPVTLKTAELTEKYGQQVTYSGYEATDIPTTSWILFYADESNVYIKSTTRCRCRTGKLV